MNPVSIERTSLDPKAVGDGIRCLDEQIAECLVDIEHNLRSIIELPSLLLARLCHVLALEPQDWIEAERVALEVLDAYELLISAVDSYRKNNLSGKDIQPDGKVARSRSGDSSLDHVAMTPADFFNAFWTAVILGDTRRLNLLVQIPVEHFIAPNVEADEFLYKWIEALQCIQGGDARWAQLFGDAIWLSHPQRAPIADSDSLHYLLYPPIKLFHTLVTGTEEQFNLDLEDALVRHDYYWGSEGERKLDPEGWVSLPLTAIACMALSKGYTVVPESGYLPLALGLEKG